MVIKDELMMEGFKLRNMLSMCSLPSKLERLRQFPPDYLDHQSARSIVPMGTGTWMGSSPSLADTIVLHQKTEFSGVLLAFNWPPSYTKTGNTFTWDSQPNKNTWYVQAERHM
ncbi:hypothetical protein P4H70_06665 [Paenibacillus ehimensis]|uniref:hypothetical protein n=1 Tax=Paenibacillus ehimensis TaxID=79264 RepID=UPI002CC74E0A|nr:hypothetical protein [Paenibacillus ehimensis]MEC0208630.1 hypothetical protein [Paenibacillus ehimensis]HWO95586.1 hypothetical protein [Bacillus sp. (in: firmicutes)]